MLKIRKLTVKDRLSVYEILQQDEILLPGAINTTMTRIDDYLFNKNDKRNRAIVVEDENAKILGYAGYGYDEQAIVHTISIELLCLQLWNVKRLKKNYFLI